MSGKPLKRRKIDKDMRIKTKPISWPQYALTYFVLLTLAAGQGMIYAEYMAFTKMPPEYIFGMLGYWALVSAAFCLITRHQLRKRFDDPMHRLSIAVKEVAGGDFSIYLEPMHSADKYDYLDVMFEDFNKMVEELGSIETLKNDFIANVSHEIKTPLSVIQSYAAMLKKENLSPLQRAEYADTIILAGKKLSALVTNILKLSKLENQEITPVCEPYDLCRQLSACALSSEDEWEKKGIEFTADIEDCLMIPADESMLEIVWQNLLANAIKFTPPGGKITLTQTSSADRVTVIIADNGCGMDGETIKHIFDKFYQGDVSRSADGNGLGLALVSRVIELVGGSISVQSEPGQGSTFTVQLQIQP